MKTELLALASKWREEAEPLRAKAAEKDAGGRFRWADWYRSEMVAQVGTLRSCAAQVEALAAQQPVATCTCPSGDGSLRWPCPQHPPTRDDPQQVAEGVRVTEAMAVELLEYLPLGRSRYSVRQATAALKAALAAQPAVPEGFRLVPVEPTEAMRAAGDYDKWNYDDAADIYRAMLAAAPEPKGNCNG